MKKEVRKHFVACKDSYMDEDLVINKGDIVLIYPIEFYDETDPDYRDYVVEDCGYDPAQALDIIVVTPVEYKNMLTTSGQFEIKCSRVVEVYELPYLFNMLKIAPRNVTVELED